MDSEKIAVGISSCLSGEAVRFNGQHKKSHFCWDVLSEYFRFTAVCPEMQAGLGVPRKPVRLVNDSQRIRVLQVDDHQIDVTEPLRTASEALVADLSGVYGFIFMQKSPSCGLHTVKTYNPKGAVMENRAMGVFAQAMQQRYPLMPMEEAGRLNDDVLRENFLLRVWAYRNLIDMVENNLSLNSLISFHSRYKYLLMAHDTQGLKKLGQLLANPSRFSSTGQLAHEYMTLFMRVLQTPSTRKSHTNVLEHIRGYLKTALTSVQKKSLNEMIKRYHDGHIPLIAAVTLLKHYFEVFPDNYINQQVYFKPYPEKLLLMNNK